MRTTSSVAAALTVLGVAVVAVVWGPVRGSGWDHLLGLLAVLVVGSVFVLLVAASAETQATAELLAPLERLADAAHRIAIGERGARSASRRADPDLRSFTSAFDEIADALERARLSSEASQRFLADAAHQLRTPVTAIRATAETLRMDLDPEDEARTLEVLVSEAARAGRLLTRLLRLAKLDMGELPKQEVVDVGSICRAEVARVRALDPRLTVEMRTDVPGDLMTEVDPTSMVEAISNVLDNACRHAATRIDLELAVVRSDIVLAIADDGPGLDATVATRAFERFVSMDGRGGSGLGLPIARAIVEAHGGTLTYEGCRFVIRLPLTGS